MRDGAFLFLAQVFVSPIEDDVFSAHYSDALRRFELFRLASGRKLRARELARLVRAGKLVLPGFHEVAGTYLRANPDDTRANNLLQRFRDFAPDEPVLSDAVAAAESECG
jgi:hypothetical protein